MASGPSRLNWVSLLNRDVREDLIASDFKKQSDDPSGEQFLRDYMEEFGAFVTRVLTVLPRVR